MIQQRPQTEYPNNNQSAFGPTNQQSTFDSGTPQTPAQNQTQNTSPASATGQPINSGWSTSLPWQANSMSAPNPGFQAQPQGANTWQVGHDASTPEGMNREQWRDAWMGSGTSNNQMMDQWLAQHGGQRMNESGVVRTPFGETLDMGIAYKTGQGRPGWTDIGQNSPSQQMPTMGTSFGQQQQPANNQLAQNQVAMGNQLGQAAAMGLGGQQSPFGPGQDFSPKMPQINPQQLTQLLQMLGQTGMKPGLADQGVSQGAVPGMNQQVRPNLYGNADANTMDISPFLGAPSQSFYPGLAEQGMM
jgi:hypothetical protein